MLMGLRSPYSLVFGLCEASWRFYTHPAPLRKMGVKPIKTVAMVEMVGSHPPYSLVFGLCEAS